MAYVARAVCVRWTYYGVSRLARGDGMLWVAGGQQRGPRRARASMCVVFAPVSRRPDRAFFFLLVSPLQLHVSIF